MKQQDVIIIFVKNLVRGKVKTRLAATMGADYALKIYKDLIAHTTSVVQKLKANKIVYYSDKIEKEDRFNEQFSKAKQQGGDLGERMKNAFREVFQQDYTKAIIIGSDCPSLNEDILSDAFESLDNNDIVIGPAYDGGYYLLGMKTLYSSLFQNIEWSTPNVFTTTIATCKNLNLCITIAGINT